MSVRPYYYLTIGDKTLDELGIEYLVKSITFVEEIGKFDSVEIVIRDGEELREAYDLCQHGAVLQLSMGYYNQLVLPMTVCFLKGVKPDFVNREVTLKFYSYLKAFDIGEKQRVLVNRTIKEIIEEIILDYEIFTVGTIDNGDLILSDTTSQSAQTDLALLEEIAEKFGMYWKVEATDDPGLWSLSLKAIDFNGSSEEHLPVYCYPPKEAQIPSKGLWLTQFSPESNILEVSSSVSIISNNPNHPVRVDNEVYDPAEYPSEVRGSQVVATVLGSVTQIQFYENLSNEEAAQIIANQLLQDNELSFVSAKNSELSNGDPRVRIGQVRKIIPKGIRLFDSIFEGDYVITRTEHRITHDMGYVTIFDGARNKLTIPPPPTISYGVGNSGGPPIVIHLMVSNGQITNMTGHYVTNFYPIEYGQEISEAEIRANQHWMNAVNARLATYTTNLTYTFSFGEEDKYFVSGDQTSGYSIEAPEQSPGAGLASAYNSPSLAGPNGIPPHIQIPVDWPSNWSTCSSVATPLARPSVAALETLTSVIPDVGNLRERIAKALNSAEEE